MAEQATLIQERELQMVQLFEKIERLEAELAKAKAAKMKPTDTGKEGD